MASSYWKKRATGRSKLLKIEANRLRWSIGSGKISGAGPLGIRWTRRFRSKNQSSRVDYAPPAMYN